jgi:N-acyl-D-aspartate/D-glutamate deacylase
MLDLVIRGGHVVDGTGAPRRRADIGVRDGRIVEIGEISGQARRTVDADGRAVTPGFIDVHTHYDAQGFWDPYLTPSPFHGVTTVLGGNCGFTIAPLAPETADYLMRTLARVEGMPLATLQKGVPWDWGSTAEFLDRLDGALALNAGFMVGHTALRRLVMGEDATRRESTPEELETMTGLLRVGLRAGAIGFSTSRGFAHQDMNGDAVPSRHASHDEIVALAAVCREFPGTSLEFIPYQRPFSDEDRETVIAMTVAARRPVNWNLINARAATLDSDLAELTISDEAAARGGKVAALTMPMDISVRYSFDTGFALDSIPGWAKDLAKPHSEKLAMLRDPNERARLEALAAGDGSRPRPDMADWGNRIIRETINPGLKRYEEQQVADIAAAEGKDPFNALLDIVCADDLRTTFSRLPNDTPADWEARARIWRDERTIIGGSDAGAHVDFLATFQFATAFLAEARDRQIFTLEEAVRHLTSRPADLYGLRDRGRLLPGARADLVILDEDTVTTAPTVTRADLPGGAKRFYAEAIGIDQVLVNGETIVSQGDLTEACPGTLLRGGRDTKTPSLA